MYKNKKSLAPLHIDNKPVIFKNKNHNENAINYIILKKNINESYSNENLINIDNSNKLYLNYFTDLAKKQEQFFSNNIKPWNIFNYELNNNAAIIAFNKEKEEIYGWMNIQFREIYFDDIYNKKVYNKDNLKFYMAIINNFDISNTVDDKYTLIHNMLTKFKDNFLKNIYIYTYNKSIKTVEYKKINIDIYCIYANLLKSKYFINNYYNPDPSFDINSTLEKICLRENQNTYEKKSDNYIFKENILFDDKKYSLSNHIFYKIKYNYNEHILNYIKHKLLLIWEKEIIDYIF